MKECDLWNLVTEDGVEFKTKAETIGQYTGLHDKNGKEIYEGDIIKDSSGYIGKVIFNTTDVASCGCCYDRFMGTGFLAEDVKPHRGYLDMDEGREVIGNIYDNPDLIGG